jgi:tRNA-binding protein
MIFSYNKEQLGDTLVVVVANDEEKTLDVVRKEDAARLVVKETGVLTGWNIFNASTHIGEINGRGQVYLEDDQFAKLNDYLHTAGFTETIEKDTAPKFVVGLVKGMKAHPDSDHLNICQVEVDNGEVLQIVAGAPNVAEGQKVVVAKIGAMMPSGLIIWSGELRGVESFGMLCSPRELALPNAPQVRGILVLDDDAIVGEPFDATKHWHG